MREHRLKLPELALIAATRGVLGFGAGLLTAGHVSAKHRRAIGLGLVIAGLASTIPIAYRLFRRREQPEEEMPEAIDGVMFAHEIPIIIAEVIE